MKKIIAVLFALFAVLVLPACGSTDGVYSGSYEDVTQYATYVANVDVEVKDGKIAKVTLKDDSNIHSPEANWTDHAAWTEHVDEILESYVGLKANDVKNSTGAPVDALAGATLSSDRLFKAVQNALMNYKG